MNSQYGVSKWRENAELVGGENVAWKVEEDLWE